MYVGCIWHDDISRSRAINEMNMVSNCWSLSAALHRHIIFRVWPLERANGTRHVRSVKSARQAITLERFGRLRSNLLRGWVLFSAHYSKNQTRGVIARAHVRSHFIFFRKYNTDYHGNGLADCAEICTRHGWPRNEVPSADLVRPLRRPWRAKQKHP